MQHSSGERSAVRVILFDAVGTLMRPVPGVAASYHHHGRQFGSQLSEEEVARRYAAAWAECDRSCDSASAANTMALVSSEADERRFWQNIVARTFYDLPNTSALFASLWQHFAEPQHWQLFDDVAEAWRQLESAGYELAIASNFDSRLLDVCRGLPPLDGCLRIFFSSQLGWRKPAAGFFRAIAERLGHPPEALLLVGDSLEHDLAGATAAGWRALCIDRRSGDAEQHVVADRLRSLTELADRLEP